MVNNKSALITASSGGLGKIFALYFAKQGYDIILHGRKDEKIQSTKKQLEELDVNVWDIKGDMRYAKTIESLNQEAKKRDIFVLIDNAAVPAPVFPLDELPNKDLEEVLSTNFYSRIKLAKSIYPLFKEKKEGIIININSIIGLESKKYKSVHSAAVWGLRGFYKSLRLEAEENNVRVMIVHPTQIKTKPEYEYGLEPEFVAESIYKAIIKGGSDDLILDGRPLEFRPKKEE